MVRWHHEVCQLLELPRQAALGLPLLRPNLRPGLLVGLSHNLGRVVVDAGAGPGSFVDSD